MSNNNDCDKNVMASNIRRFMNQKGVTATDVYSSLNIKKTTFYDWINAKSYPRIDKISLLAEYFCVSKSDLVEKHHDTELQDADSIHQIVNFVYKNEEYKVLFDECVKLDKKDIDFVVDLMKRMNH